LASIKLGDRRDGLSGVPENAAPGADARSQPAFKAVPLKEQRRQDCARRH
jgi:hypothetical protein